MRPLVLIGGGGHCKSVIDVAESVGFPILGIIDKLEMVGSRVLDYEVIGTDNDIPDYVDKADFVISVGQIKSPDIRRKIAEIVYKAGGHFATIIASDAYVSKHSKICEGTVIMHKAFVNADAKLGSHCIVNSMANIEHDCVIGDFCHISTGVMINGGCKVGNNCFFGSQTVLANGIAIEDDIVVGAGSFVRNSLREKGVYFGNPVILQHKQ